MKKTRKYEVTLPNGRVVSRQYAHELKLREEDPEKFNKLRKEKYARNKERIIAYQREWMAKFKEEHGMSYSKWYNENKKDAKK